MNGDVDFDVRYFRLSPRSQPYFTALYLFDVRADGTYICDQLHPEWAAMRFSRGTPPIASVGAGALEPQWPFVVSGPTSKSIRFQLTSACIWGLGLQPAGWAKFVDGRARDFADRTLDGAADPAFEVFAPILRIVEDDEEPEVVVERIDRYLLSQASRPSPQEERIIRCHQLVRDPEIATVAQLGEELGVERRSLERLCARYFGFPPKLLLRRQRFLRSLARFMLEGHRHWSEVLDERYYDQAQFVRDFRSFMGMTPSEYAEMPHPILTRIMAQRMADQGAAPETDLPTILRYSTER